MARNGPPGRAAIVEAATRLIGAADTTNALAFLSYRAVAGAAHVRPGTVEYHFPTKDDLNRATLSAAVDFYAELDHEPILRALRGLSDGTGDLGALAEAMGEQLGAMSPEGPRLPALAGAGTAVTLALAAAPRDPEAAALLRSGQEAATAGFAELHAATLAATRRRWRAEYDAQRMARLTQVLVSGFLFVRRYNPEHASVDLFVDAWLRLFLGMTEDIQYGDPDAVDVAAARLGVASGDDVATRAAMLKAAQETYAERGWQGLTDSAVASRLGVPRAEVLRLVGSRRGLAAAVWAGRVPRFARTLSHLQDVESLEDVVRGYLDELVSTVRDDMSLTAALLEGLLAVTTHGGSDPRDPHALVPLAALLEPHVEARMDQLEPGGLDASDVAQMLVGYALYLAFTRPEWPAERVVAVIVGTTYRGMTRQTTP
jgi:AcrR family transcriptional regulator